MKPTMDDHQQWREQLISYLYEECTRDEAAAFESHLGGCPECQQDLSAFSAVRHGLQSWQIAEYPHLRLELKPTFFSSFTQAIRLLPVWGQLAGAAAILVLVFAIVNVDVHVGGPEGFRFRVGVLPQREAQTAPRDTPPEKQDVGREEIITMVNALIGESEKRQEKELQVALTDLRSRLENDSRVNLVKFTEGLKRDQKTQFDEIRRSLLISAGLKYTDLFGVDQSDLR